MIHKTGRIIAILVWLIVFGSNFSILLASPAERLGLDLIDIGTIEPGIILDVKYATQENFTNQILYPVARCLLRESVAQRLAEVHRTLRIEGMGLKVFDCYRPLSVQKKMWTIFPDERYVANPASGSRHNRGASVDVGLTNAVGKELPMPSSYDEFSERSHLDFLKAKPEEIKNRSILQNAMRAQGFLAMSTEWWHFDAPDWKSYPIGDADMRLVPEKAEQVIAVKEPRAGYVVTEVWAYEKKGSSWIKVFGPIDANLGKNGIAEFDGKREGDGKTPRGVFKLGTVFGYLPVVNTRMPYRQSTENDAWIDDPVSLRYNQWVVGIPLKESYERMRRSDNLYRLGIVIEYNTDPVIAWKGSAIFIHNWESFGKPTAGCISFEPAELEKIVAWIDPQRNPVILIGYSEN